MDGHNSCPKAIHTDSISNTSVYKTECVDIAAKQMWRLQTVAVNRESVQMQQKLSYKVFRCSRSCQTRCIDAGEVDKKGGLMRNHS